MVRPVDGVRAFHNAFRHDMERIDAAALDAARGREGVGSSIERYRFFNEILSWHAHGEEVGIFPVLETVAPLVAEAYVKDHRGLDSAFHDFDASFSRRNPLETARAAAAFRFHLNLHLYREETHLYRIFEERVSLPEQGRAVAVLAGSIPPERFADAMTWLFPLIGRDDRENMTRILQASLPAPAFARVRALLRQTIGSDWTELARRVPRLDAR